MRRWLADCCADDTEEDDRTEPDLKPPLLLLLLLESAEEDAEREAGPRAPLEELAVSAVDASFPAEESEGVALEAMESPPSAAAPAPAGAAAAE